MKQRPGFMLYFELVPALSSMEDAEAGTLFKALMAYAQYGEVRDLTGLAAFAFEVMRGRIDQDAENYAEKCRKNAYAAYVREAQRRGETPLEYEVWCSPSPDDVKRYPTQHNDNTNSSAASVQRSAGDAGRPLPPVEYGEFLFSREVKAVIEAWLRYKAERRETYTPTGLRSLFSQLKGNLDRHGEGAVLELMRQSMASGYRGIPFDRLEKGGGSRPNRLAEEPSPQGEEWMREYIQRRDRERKRGTEHGKQEKHGKD